MPQPSLHAAGFWAGGAASYENALAAQFWAELRKLQERREQTPSQAERQQLTAAIDRLRADHRRRLMSITTALF